MSSINERILIERKKKGLSQEELAARIGVSRQAVSKWESAAATPDLDKIVALSAIFDVSLDYLIKGEKAPSNTRAKKKVDALVFTIIATAVNVIALVIKITTFNNFRYVLGLFFLHWLLPLVLMVISLTLYFLGLVIGEPSSQKRASRIYWSINIWIILFFIISLVFVLILSDNPNTWYDFPLYPSINTYIQNLSPYSKLYEEALAEYDVIVSYFYTFWSLYAIFGAVVTLFVNRDLLKKHLIKTNK